MSKRTANDAYAEHAKAIEQHLETILRGLDEMTAKRNANVKRNPKSWAYVGDAEHAANQLANVAAFMRNEEQ